MGSVLDFGWTCNDCNDLPFLPYPNYLNQISHLHDKSALSRKLTVTWLKTCKHADCHSWGMLWLALHSHFWRFILEDQNLSRTTPLRHTTKRKNWTPLPIHKSSEAETKTSSPGLMHTYCMFTYNNSHYVCLLSLVLAWEISLAFSFLENPRAARSGMTGALARHLMPSSWHQGPLKDSSGLWNQPAVYKVQRFNKFQGSSQGRVTLWMTTQNQKSSKYLRMLIIDSLNPPGTIPILHLMNMFG